jgi:hypothetical protein
MLVPLGTADHGGFAGLGFRRLSILDRSPAADGLLRALSTWREIALTKIEGIFSLADYHARSRRILLARDPLGIKPLYVAANDKGFDFAPARGPRAAAAQAPALISRGVCTQPHAQAGCGGTRQKGMSASGAMPRRAGMRDLAFLAIRLPGVVRVKRGLEANFLNGDPPMRTTRATVVAVVLLALTIAVPSHAIDINGGSSWSGWDHRGNSLDVGIWGAGSTTRSYELYTTTFTFNDNTFDSSTGGTQVRADGAPLDFAAGTYSPGAFANGNTIFGIGLDLNGSANTNGKTFVSFGLGGDDFRAASALGAGDGRVSLSTWGHAGDFSLQSDNTTGAGPSSLGVLTNDGTSQGGSGSFNYLVGGIGSGVSYDFAFRTFINGGEGGAIQMFFDLTAMEELYNSGGSHYITYGWTNGPGSIGAIGNHFNISLYNADAGYLNANQVTFGNIPVVVPEPSSLALVTLGLLCVAAAGGSARTPRDSDAGASAAVGSDLRADPGTQTARAR